MQTRQDLLPSPLPAWGRGAARPPAAAKWLAVAASLVLARLAQHPGSASGAPFWVILATIASIALAAWVWPWPLPAVKLSADDAIERPRTTVTGACLLLVPSLIAFAIWSREDFQANLKFVNPSSSWAVLVWLGGIAGAVTYLWKARLPSEHPSMSIHPFRFRVEYLIFAGILAVAAWLRLWNLSTIPEGIWWDVANYTTFSSHLFSQTFQPLDPGSLGFIPSFFSYVIAAVMAVAGTSLYSVRLSSALFGIMAVGVTYLLGRKIGGARYGLAAAALLAISKWAIDFSRYGMPQIAAPAILALAFVFLASAMSRPRAVWFALSGLMLGIGLQAYYGAILTGGLAFLVVGLRLLRDREFRREAWPSALLGPVGLVAGAAPLLTVLFLDPTATLSHEHGVSLFSQYSTLHDQITALLSSLRSNLLMFTVQGDANGRQNLPGSPMLDPITGTLFLIGLGMCARRLSYWFCQLLVLWVGSSLLSGVFSVSYDAPNSGRAIAAVAAIALIAAMPVASFVGWLISQSQPAVSGENPWQQIRSIRGSAARPLAAAAVALVPLGIAVHDNYDDYFVKQASDVTSWVEMGGLQAVIGHTASTLQVQGYTVKLPLNLSSDPALMLAAGGRSFASYDPAVPVPLSIPAGGLSLIIPTQWMDLLTNAQIASIYTRYGIISSTSTSVLEFVLRLYPTAHLTPLTMPGQPGNIAAQVVLIPSKDEADTGNLTLDQLYTSALHDQDSGDYAGELAYLDAVARVNPNYGDTLFAKGWALWNLGRREAAVSAYRGYLAHHPDNGQALLNLGYSLIVEGHCAEAIAPLKHVLKLQPANHAARQDLAVCAART